MYISLVVFFMRYLTINQQTQHSFKKRFKLCSSEKENIFFNQLAIFFLPYPITFEYVYLKAYRRVIKKIIKRRVITKKKNHHSWLKRKAWLHLVPNFPISRKSKNSRMGKGVGAFFRWSLRLPRYFIIMKSKRINRKVCNKICNWFKNKLNIDVIFS